jgi:hypothetical protein
MHCIILWGHSGASQRLFRLQRRAIGFIANLSYREDCRNHLKKLKVLILPSLYIYGRLQYIFNNKESFDSLSSFHNYTTRSHDICISSLRLSRSRHGAIIAC